MKKGVVKLNRQQVLNNNKAKKDSQNFGDNMNSIKSKESMRMVFQNINGFGYLYKDIKTERIRNFIVENKIDTMMMAEINTNWRIINNKNSMNQISKK